jgi:diacylglycerol kinase (ATP)
MSIGRWSSEIIRLKKAFGYSLSGLRMALGQPAFRIELLVGVPMLLLAFLLPVSGVARAVLVGSIFLVWLVELLNSAVEAAIDRVGPEIHPLSKQAKDMASAAVLLALVNAGLVWACVLWG